jgi:hypothetical protein
MSDHDRRSREQDHEHRYQDDFDPALDELWPPPPAISPGKRSLTQSLYPVQRSAAHAASEDPDEVRRAASAGVAGSGGPLPYLEAIQRSFGRHDISGIRAHTGSEAAAANEAMGSRAYATGDRVAFAGSPDLHTAAHEAAHVIQQRAGVHLAGGVGKAGDEYERHADAVADAVVRGEVAERLLDRLASGRGGPTAVQHQGRRQGSLPDRQDTVTFTRTETYESFLAEVRQWLRTRVRSRSTNDATGNRVRRERVLVPENALRGIYSASTPGEPITLEITRHSNGFSYRSVTFVIPGNETFVITVDLSEQDDDTPTPDEDQGGGTPAPPEGRDSDGGGPAPVEVPEGVNLPRSRRREEIGGVIVDNAPGAALEVVGFISAGVLGTLASTVAAALTVITIGRELAELADNGGAVADGAKGYSMAYQAHRIAATVFRSGANDVLVAHLRYRQYLSTSDNAAYRRLDQAILGGMPTLNRQFGRAMRQYREGNREGGDGRSFANVQELSDYLVANAGGPFAVRVYRDGYHEAYKSSGSYIRGTPRLRG